ncbi:MAG TPA: hypothetical protein VEB59_13310 [Gemmatimonadales bacterium]|nr:hypothetical protein [Gemmatimonadales bacterium]
MAGLALLAGVCCLAEPAETLRLARAPGLPPPGAAVAGALGRPAVRLAGDRARVWLVRVGDTVAVYALVRDPTLTPSDEIVVSVDPAGDAGPAPRHDDFQWRIRRSLDSSVVYRGREGRWAPPRDDPDWRLGAERGGGGWEVSAVETGDGWCLVLRLHAAFFEGEAGRRPRAAFRFYTGEPDGWFAWPGERSGAHPSAVEDAPDQWAVTVSSP